MITRLFLVLFLLSIIGIFTPARAEVGLEIEPNNSCQSAQDFTRKSYPFSVSGDVANGENDFFKFTGTPNTLIKIEFKSAPSDDASTYLNVYGANCHFIKGSQPQEELVVTVPKEGEFRVNVINYGFDAYTVVVSTVNAIGSISGHIVDSMTRQPLINAGHTLVRLYRCRVNTCGSYITQKPDKQGLVRFTKELDGTPLVEGHYKISASSYQYEPAETLLMSVAKHQHKKVSIALKSYPARISVTPCNNIPSSGGVCKFTVTVTNGETKPLSAMVWNIVQGSFIDLSQSTAFPVLANNVINLAKLGSHTSLRFSFDVPAGVLNGASICTRTYVGAVGKDAGFNIKGTNDTKDARGFNDEPLGFCIEKRAGNSGLTFKSD